MTARSKSCFYCGAERYGRFNGTGPILCRKHYMRVFRYGTPERRTLERKGAKCICGCDKKVHARGRCEWAYKKYLHDTHPTRRDTLDNWAPTNDTAAAYMREVMQGRAA